MIVYDLMQTVDKTVTVAVKLAKSNCSTDDKIRFMREAAIMGQFKHKNILYLYGAVLQGDPVQNKTKEYTCVDIYK